MKDAEENKNTELRFLRRCGIAIEINYENNNDPCLVNLAPDPMLSGTLLYLIPPGTVRIRRHNINNREKQMDTQDILLDGPLVASLHWLVASKKNKKRDRREIVDENIWKKEKERGF